MKKKRLIFLFFCVSLLGGRLLAENNLPQDILITEIMANPDGSTYFPETGYIEIFNNTASSIDLKDWFLIAVNEAIALPDLVLSAGQYAILYEDGKTIHIDAGGLAVPLPAFPSDLTNLKIESPDGTEIDAVTCPAPTPARSWERDGDGNMYLSNDLRGGTPGSVNSPAQTPPVPDVYQYGDIWINEVMVNPGVAPSEFGNAEYVEIYNASSAAINLKGWKFIYHSSATSSTVLTLPDVSLPVGGYAVLYRSDKILYVDKGGIAIPFSNFPATLGNTGRLLEIKSPGDVLIYDYTYPNSSSFVGSSWERDYAGNYFLSNDPRGGTPGSVNSPDNVVGWGDIWINEIMVNPGTTFTLGNAEYVELYNASGNVINLRNWKLIYHANTNSNTVVTIPGIILPAGGYAVIYRADDKLSIDVGGIAIPIANFPSTLANAGRLLEVKNSKDVLIDAVNYPNSDNYSGCSWERDGNGNYFPSNDPRGGTPGSVNSTDNSRAGDIRINEIMVNPGGNSTLGDAEYVELFNTTASAINVRGWFFIYHANATSSTVVTLPGVTIPAGGYAVLYRTGDKLVIDAGVIVIQVANFPSTLGNTGRLLELKNSLNVLIDAVEYPNSTNLPGCSWERDNNGNLYPSNDPRGGTPGSVNSYDNSRSGNIGINEIMVMPVGSKVSETEYVELYNLSPSEINLQGWKLVYDSRTVVTIPGVLLPSGGYAVLYRSDRIIHVDAGGIPIPLSNFPSTLANTGRLLELKNSRDVLIDSVTYSNSTLIPGCSWERDRTGTFYPSSDPRGGTPGSVNSSDNSRPGDLWINEIMVNPTGATGLPETEYVELYNTSNVGINLRGWTLIYDSRTVVTLPGVILSAGGYAVLYREGKDIRIDAGGSAIPVANFPSTLAKEGRLVEIKNSRGVLIDYMTYKNSASLAGCSWERDRDGYFYPSNDPRGGTPGSVNTLDNSRFGDVWINEIMANPTGATVLPETEYVELYNASGMGINVRGWSLIYDSRTVVILPGIILPPGGYGVLYRTGKDIRIAIGGISIPVGNFPATLANEGRLLELKNSKDILIDSVTYPNSTKNPGRSWERDRTGYYYLSNDSRGGTPGSVNSPTEIPVEPDFSIYGDVWINEVMADPRGLKELPETEYIELLNASESPINLRGWSLIYDERVNMPFPDVILPVNGYAVLYRSSKEILIDNGGIAIPVANFPVTLANSGRKLALTNSLSVLIDSITYAAAISARSWERDSEGSFYLSTNRRGGTPGSVNSSKIPVIEPDDTQYGDVRINEIMANPTGSTAFYETEYIEIYNTSRSDIVFKGWSLIYDTRTIALPDVILPIGGYAVLYRSSNELLIDDGGIAIPMPAFPAALANTGSYLALTHPKGYLIDSISYPAAKEAWSWERDTDGSLYLSNNPRGGTPGSVNSLRNKPEEPNEPSLYVGEKEWIFNELLPEEFPGGSEYIELYNHSSRSLYLSGLSIATRRSDGSFATNYALSSIKESFQPGEYVVLTTSRSGVLDFYHTPTPDRIYELRLPTLNNSEARLVLFRTTDAVVIDEIGYSSKWHDQFMRNLKGVALERIKPDDDTQNSLNWTSAATAAGYGTPGYVNSQNRSPDAVGTVHVGIPEFADGYGHYTIPYQVDKNGYRCRMEVYSLEGKRVAEISNNQLLGFEGELRWDGYGMDGSRLRTGLYIFYAELYHPDGQRKSFKNAFLVKP